MTTPAAGAAGDVEGAPSVCGAGVWLLASSGPDPLDEYRAYRTQCQAAPNHPGDHKVQVAGEPDDSTAPVEPVTLAWLNPAADYVTSAVMVVARELGRAEVVAGCCPGCTELCDRIDTFEVCNDMHHVARCVLDALQAAGWQLTEPEAKP